MQNVRVANGKADIFWLSAKSDQSLGRSLYERTHLTRNQAFIAAARIHI